MPNFAKTYYLLQPKQCLIQITNQVDYDIQEFPILISFPTTWVGFSILEPDGSNIAFLDKTGKPLYFYIRKIEVSNGVLETIVKLPILKANETTTIRVLMGLTPNPYSSYHDVKKAYNWVEDFETGTLENWNTEATSQYPPTILSDTTMINKEGTYYARISRYGESASVGEYTRMWRTLGVPETSRWAIELLYYIYGAGGYDSRDVVEAQVRLGGNTLWSKQFAKEYTEYGELSLEGEVSPDNSDLEFYTEAVSVYGGWLDTRIFAVDFIRVRKTVDPYPLVEVPNELLGVKDLDVL